MRKYTFNYNYFDVIDNEEKAYWLGFLYADGYILSENNGFGCALNEKDLEHLKKFLNAININTLDCLKYQKNTNSYRFTLFEEHFYNRLKELGFTTDKSYCNDLILWNNIPDIFKKDFIRGLWDGDGYVTVTAGNANIAGLISNNEQLLQVICDFFNKELNITNCHITKSDGYPRIRLTHKIARNAMKLLYKNNNIALDRKYNAYLQWKPSVYDKQYKYLRQLPSGRYYIYIPLNKKKTTVGTFDTVKECIEAFNKVAIENNIPTQEYIDENLVKEED